jgi:hypothetical protein
MKSKLKILMSGAAATLLGLLAVPIIAHALPSAVVYDATPNPLPPNVASLGYEATSTSQFGDSIHLGGTNRTLKAVTVTMSDWALYADYATDARYSGNSTTWMHPITVNVYGTQLDGNGVPTTLLATMTQNVTIPWRPVADPTCANPTAWRAADTLCYNGFAFNAQFDLSSLNVTLPNDVIVGVAYNTADYGAAPIHLAGPYNSLNVGIPTGQTASVGSDDSADKVFFNTSFAGFYADGGASGVGTFREDTGWTGNGTVAFQIEATPVLTTPPTNKDQCKNDGWKTFNNPSFKNRDKCIDYVKKHSPADSVKGTLVLSNPSQKIKFNVLDSNWDWNWWHKNKKDAIEYWNYDAGLHYKANVLCVGGDKSLNEARVMFQIPPGNPYSGLYVVAYVKDVKGKHAVDLYGHAATSDQPTAQAWCETGAGFSPTMYTVTSGKVEIN